VAIADAARSVGAHRPDLGRYSGDDQMLYHDLGPGVYHFRAMPRFTEFSGVMLAEMFAMLGTEPGHRRVWLRNFSGRARVGAGDRVLIGGIVVEGTEPLRVLVRGIGPGLAGYGVPGVAEDPRVTLFNAGGAPLASNDDWDETDANRALVQDASALVGAFPLAAGARDAATVFELEPGVFTVVVSADPGAGGAATGVALLEVYAID
jgi:hypothetical protein